MKRIFLLIFLVMMATWFLRDSEERWARERMETFRSHRARRPKPHNFMKALDDQVVDAEWAEPSPRALVDPETRKISSQMMATEDRAKADAIGKLEGELADWLSPEIPETWKPPVKLVRSMIQDVKYQPVVKDYGTLYVAELTADTSTKRREKIIEVYQRETIQHRMLALGGTLAFVLACLGIISGYIRADEATKGYYTSRLRLLAAAGVGAAGMAVYRFI